MPHSFCILLKHRNSDKDTLTYGCSTQDKLAYFKDNIATEEDDFDASQYYYNRQGGHNFVALVAIKLYLYINGLII